MDDRERRVHDLRQVVHQLEEEVRRSALTPGEAEKNRDQREAALEELRSLGAAAGPEGVP